MSINGGKRVEHSHYRTGVGWAGTLIIIWLFAVSGCLGHIGKGLGEARAEYCAAAPAGDCDDD